MKLIAIFNLLLIASIPSYSQGSFSLSMPVIYNTVEVTNNWSPPTAINRKNQFNGTSLGYGVNLNYSFRPTFIVKNHQLFLNIGVGYFMQRFDLQRPFDYVSPLQPIFYTDHYSYHCLQVLLGISYKYSINSDYFLIGNFSYSGLNSFRQQYTPTSNAGYGRLTQINHNQIDFGNMLMLAMGLNRNLGDRFSLGLSVLIPLYIRWRNDKIFKDDPTKYFHPKSMGGNISSIGGNISIGYYLKSK